MKYSWFIMCEFVLYIHVIHIIFQVLSHYRLLQDTEYICICPVLYSRSLLVISFIYSCVQIPNISHPPSPLLAVFVSVSLVYFCFVNTFICIIFLDSVHKWYMIFVLLWFTSFSMIISRSIHVVANGIISFFFMAE